MSKQTHDIETTLKTGLKALFLIILLSFITACSKKHPSQQLQGDAFGTRYHITLVDTPETLSADQLHIEIERALKYYDLVFSTYKPASELNRLNQTKPGTTLEVSEPLYKVIESAQKLSLISSGAYDVTASPLIKAWGFGDSSIPEVIPDKESILALKNRTGYSKLQLQDKNTVYKTAHVEADLSSIAKGYIVDQVSKYLFDQGVQNHLVEIGGEIAVKGYNPSGKKWRLGIEQPGNGVQTVAQAVTLTDRALATSGDYRNYYVLDGKKYSHTIDPSTGYPVDHQLASVTVIMESVMMADGWATMLNVLGPEKGLSLAEEHNIAAFFMVYSKEGVQSFYTPAMGIYLDD